MEPLVIHYVFSLKIRGSLVIHYDFGNSGGICSRSLKYILYDLTTFCTRNSKNAAKAVTVLMSSCLMSSCMPSCRPAVCRPAVFNEPTTRLDYYSYRKPYSTRSTRITGIFETIRVRTVRLRA